MNVLNVPIHHLRLSAELKARGYERPDTKALTSFSELGPLYPCIVTRVKSPSKDLAHPSTTAEHLETTEHAEIASARSQPSQQFEILAQEDVWFAAQSLGVDKIPVLEIEPSDKQQRAQFFGAQTDDNPIAKAEHYQSWLNETDLYLNDSVSADEPQTFHEKTKQRPKRRTITALARLEGCTRSNVSHQLRLLTLDTPVQHLLRAKMLTAAHGKELLKHNSEEGRVLMAVRAAEHQWSVLELRKHLKEQRSNNRVKDRSEKAPKKDRETERLEQRLTEVLGSPVTLNIDRGVLEINYMKNLDVLDGILREVGYRG